MLTLGRGLGSCVLPEAFNLPSNFRHLGWAYTPQSNTPLLSFSVVASATNVIEPKVTADDLSRFERKAQLTSLVLAGVAVVFLYAIHLFFCQRSTLPFMDDTFKDSDMHANLMWARGIREQGWLNPHPYHPYLDWMQAFAPYSQWVQWWGGEQIFQQSPLYAYLLSLFLNKLLLMRVLQALMSIGTCAFLGLFTARMSGRSAGWIALWLAALYAPFYVYSWPLLRDGLTWLITAALLWSISELTHWEWSSQRALRLSCYVGASLGLGFLARETYLLVIPAALLALGWLAWRRHRWHIIVRVAIATLLTVSPLLIRNWVVKAPLLSSSNRLPEAIILFNAGTSEPNDLVFPKETGDILYQTHGHPVSVLLATITTHPTGLRGWMHLQSLKLLSVFDPYESPDNLSFYFVERISPVVRFGVRYWMVLPLAICGLFVGIRRRDRNHFWIWLFSPIFFLSLFVVAPLSRYRQSLAVFMIPLAAYFLVYLYALVCQRHFSGSIAYGAAVVISWVLILGPLSRQPRQQYERPAEYIFSAEIYHQHGDDQKALAILNWVHANFHKSPDARH